MRKNERCTVCNIACVGMCVYVYVGGECGKSVFCGDVHKRVQSRCVCSVRERETARVVQIL